jgi:hypothetical protein
MYSFHPPQGNVSKTVAVLETDIIYQWPIFVALKSTQMTWIVSVLNAATVLGAIPLMILGNAH